jgi:hypothetical protein
MPDADPLPPLALLPKRKRGPKKLPAADLRGRCVSVRLNGRELFELDAARALVQMQRGEYLRSAAIGVLPPTIPEINRQAWADLARVCGNLNQYQHLINAGEAAGHDPMVIDQLTHQVQKLRAELLGIREKEAQDESEN